MFLGFALLPLWCSRGLVLHGFFCGIKAARTRAGVVGQPVPGQL